MSPCRIEGPLFDTGVVLRCAICTARGWHQIAQHMHNPNGIIGARSASPACNCLNLDAYLQLKPSWLACAPNVLFIAFAPNFLFIQPSSDSALDF